MAKGKGKGTTGADVEKKTATKPKDGKYVVVARCKHDGKRYEVGTEITDAKVISALEPLGVFGNIPAENTISTNKGVVGDDK